MKVLCLLLPLALVAKPTGMKTISGNASCKEQAGTVVIESGKRAVVKWDEFSIGKGEKVRFSMPNKKSAILNRVSGARSEILGQMESNGQVYLLNPKGVLIGKEAVINTAGFVASSLDVLDQNFLRGEELLFSGDSEADIVNLGTISSRQGDVALIAHKVLNYGKIHGKFVGLATGPKVLLKPKGNQRIFIQAKGGDSLQHSGEIQALVAELRAGSAYDHAIGCSGKIDATKTEKRNGRVYLVAEHGKNNFDGEVVAKGGEVHILGDHIFMGDHANINVSDTGKAGTVLVGGDYRGMNFEIPNSLDVTVSSGATVKADGEQIGDGGKVIFWADRVMHHNGIVSARGGSEGGDGGFIEVSGHQDLRDPHVRCDTRAPFGKFGTILFDPEADITISTGANSGMNTTPYTFTPTASPAVLNTTTLINALANGNVIVTTTGVAVTPTGTGIITVSDPITWSSSTSLTLMATSDVDINTTITNTSGSFAATSSTGNVNVNTGASISTDEISLTASAGAVNVNAASLTCGSGGMTLTATQGAANTTNAISITSNSTLTTNAGNILISGDASLESGASDLRGVRIGSSSVTSATGSAGTITISGEGGGGTTDNHGVHLATATVTSTLGDIAISGNQTSVPTSTGTANQGIRLDSTSLVTTLGTANIQLTGTGGNGTSSNHGIAVDSSSVISDSAATGTVTLNGVAGDGTGGTNHGIFLTSSANINSTAGAITINGNQAATPSTGGSFNLGVLVQGSSTVSSLGTGSTAATIGITGTGGAGTNSNRGVQVESSTISGVDGAITITAAPGGGTNTAIQIESSSTVETTGSDTGTTTDNVTITTTSGDIVIETSTVGVVSDQSDISITTPNGGSIGISSTASVTKTGAAGTLLINAPMVSGTDDAVTISASTVSSTDGLTITGTKTAGSGIGVNVTSVGLVTFGVGGSLTGTGIDDDGVSFTVAGTTITAGSGNPTITGTVSSLSTATARGVDMGTVAIVGGAGNLSITGTNNTTAAVSDLSGIRLAGPTITQTGSGTMAFTGTGGTGTSDNYGIFINNSTAISASSGALSFMGTGGAGTSTDNTGILVNSLSTIAATNDAQITMVGTSGAGTDTDRGILIQTAGTEISCVNGGISLTGTSLSNSATQSSGVLINVSALVETTGSGDISINGTGSAAAADIGRGAAVSDATVTSSGSGAISITGQGDGLAASTQNIGVVVQDSGVVSSTGTGRITLNGTGGNGTSGLNGVRIDDGVVTSINGNISATGNGGFGTGGGSHGIRISSAGTVSSTGAATITFDGTAGGGAVSDTGVFATNSGTTITSSTGAISLTGRASSASTTGIHITDEAIVSSTVSAPITLRTFSDIIIDEGGQVIGSSSPVRLDSARDLIITGHQTLAIPSGVFLGSGNAIISADRDVEVNGGAVAGTFAQIGAPSSSSARIIFTTIGGSLLVDAVDSDSYAIIGHGDPTSGDTFSGNISFDTIAGGTTIMGADAGAGTAGFAQIGHIGSAAATLSGNITVRNFGGDFDVQGGAATATSIARVGHGATGVASTFTASNMLVAAGANFNIVDGTAAVAEVVNAAPGNLTIIADNQNPIPPGFSNVGVTIDGIVAAATGEVRIYTVDRPLNTILTTINGEAFTPPAEKIDNPQEQFGIYFPLGVYSTAAFRIYYKFAFDAPRAIDLLNGLLVANAELQDRLPLFRYMRLPNYPFYHTNICEERRRRVLCDPGFDPYGSLNFQDDVYWIGNSQ